MKDYIFVHINKCGGHSVKKALGWPPGNWQHHKHERIGCIKDRMRKKGFNRMFKFAIIRHPYGRIQSMYYYRKHIQRRQALNGMAFDEWFYKAFTEDFSELPIMNEPCYNWISIDGEIAVDFIGKLESIKQDWQKICARLGVEVALPKENTGNYKPVHFTADMKRIIKDKFKKDFALYD